MEALSKNMHILVVDDQAPSRMLARLRLQELGFNNIHWCEDGNEAMEYVAASHKEGKPVELILCDHEMPEVDGFQFFRVLRMSEECKDIPMIMVTAHSEPELVKEMLDRGIRSFIVKPLTTAELSKKLVEAMVRTNN